MPHVHWKGIDISGNMHCGDQYTPSRAHLDRHLFKKGIALTTYRVKRHRITFARFGYRAKASLFSQLTLLLKSHILLADACGLIAQQTSHPRAQALLFDIEQTLLNGKSLHAALLDHQKDFDNFLIALLAAGEEAGTLTRATEMATHFLEMKATFWAQVRSAVMMPAITSVFLISAIIIVCNYIIPQMNMLYLSIGKETPASTQKLISLGGMLSAWGVIIYTAITTLFIFLIKRIHVWEKWKDKALLSLPICGTLTKKQLIAWWAQGMSLLLDGGIPMTSALATLEKSMPNSLFRNCLGVIKQNVSMGVPLAQALALQPSFFPSDVIALISIGQEAESLSHMLDQISNQYNQLIQQQLLRLSITIQPLLMIILGIFVAGLIFSIYAPILMLSSYI